jgi:hypothetical protein
MLTEISVLAITTKSLPQMELAEHYEHYSSSLKRQTAKRLNQALATGLSQQVTQTLGELT